MQRAFGVTVPFLFLNISSQTDRTRSGRGVSARRALLLLPADQLSDQLGAKPSVLDFGY
jgi:hypothetical protein